jgi:hypothetical protein
MKTTSKITLALAAVGAAALVIYVARRVNTKADSKRMLKQVADEGYETATDILFPGKKIAGSHLHYGPVLPG